MKLLSVVGARPNFVKIAPILKALAEASRGRPIESLLVHTGQHYDPQMSAAFFAELAIPPPDRTLGVGSGSHATQTAEIMRRFEAVLCEERPDAVLVVGDVNSTVACALTAAKLQVRVAHVEAGLRSFDRRMPEEINRVVTDALADLLFTSEASANDNLRREGHAAEQVCFVGNVMIDSLRASRQLAERSTILDRLGLVGPGGVVPYALATVHRPGNVDAKAALEAILGALAELAAAVPVILPAHPRTRARITEFGLTRGIEAGGAATRGRVTMIEPLGYVDCVRLMSAARVVLTDSGGMQEETTWLGVPCVTLRDRTERPITVTAGTSTLVGNDPARIRAAASAALRDGPRAVAPPPLWDGHAAERIVRVLLERL